MLRTFQTHEIRKQEELTDRLWEFTPCGGEFAGKTYPVATPCCWESLPGLASYRGEGVFRRTFEGGGNLRLEFKGVSLDAVVSLDGREIARHSGAYAPFCALLKDVPQGIHTIEVRADNRNGEGGPCGGAVYGGIVRPVALERLSTAFITSVRVTPSFAEGGWRAELAAEVYAFEDAVFALQSELCGKKMCWMGKVKGGERRAFSALLRMDKVEPWSPDSPKLYPIKTQLLIGGAPVDDLIGRVAFRETAVEGDRMLLNGKRVRIKGVCYREDHPQFGCALPYRAIAADLQLIRGLGANSVRAECDSGDDVLRDLCDEFGLLMWEDLAPCVCAETERKKRPVNVIEPGAEALYGCHNGYGSKWTEEYQARELTERLRACAETENCLGVYVRQLCDTRADGGEPVPPRGMNNEGLTDEYRRKKLAYNAVREMFCEKDGH